MDCAYKVYCLSYRNDARKAAMTRRFEALNVDYSIYQGVGPEDKRIHPDSYVRCWSVMYGHLDMIRTFRDDPTVEYGVFCEDDICIRKDLKEAMPRIIQDFERLSLDVLLLGYLVPFRIQGDRDPSFPLKDSNFEDQTFEYHDYPDDVWGTQMYMLSKTSAETLLEKYGEESNYAINSLSDTSLVCFSADWTLTKDGNRALVTPCLAVETLDENFVVHGAQESFHKACHEAHYDPDLFEMLPPDNEQTMPLASCKP